MLANWWFTDLILVGTFWFWALIIAVSIGMVILVEIEKAGFAFLVLLGTLITLQFASDLNIIQLVVQHPWMALVGVIGYAAIGVVWSMVKLHFYEKTRRAKYDSLKRSFGITHDLSDEMINAPIPEALKSQWATYLEKNGPRYDSLYYLRNFNDPSQHQGRIVSWIGYWPFSFIFTICNDPLRRIGNAIFESLRGTYASIVRNAWKGVEGDFSAEDLKKIRQNRR